MFRSCGRKSWRWPLCRKGFLSERAPVATITQIKIRTRGRPGDKTLTRGSRWSHELRSLINKAKTTTALSRRALMMVAAPTSANLMSIRSAGMTLVTIVVSKVIGHLNVRTKTNRQRPVSALLRQKKIRPRNRLKSGARKTTNRGHPFHPYKGLD